MAERVYTRDEILAALTIMPCHVTGMHDPDHHLRHTCDIQRAAAFKGVLALVEASEADLPRALHENCYSCHGIPSQEQYRERNRKTHAWAGVPVPPDLAAPAPDAPCFDVPKRKMLATVKRLSKTAEDGWVSRWAINEALGVGCHAGPKTGRPLGVLVADGKLEESYINLSHHVRPA